MSHAPDQFDESSEPQCPPRLASDLGELFGRSPKVSARVDDAILNLAAAKLAGRRSRQSWVRIGTFAAAAAALVLVAIWAANRGSPTGSAPPQVVAKTTPSQAVFAEHIKQQVDILDAFALARQLDAGRKPAAEWDFNHDGVVDHKDVDAIAMAAVQLKGDADAK